MKIKIAYLFAATVLLCTGYACPGAQAQQPAPDFAPKTGADEGSSRESRRQRLLDKFDLNHDGTLDGTEREKMRAAREEKIKQMGTDGGRRGGGRRMGLDGAGGPGAGVPGSGPGGPGAPGGPEATGAMVQDGAGGMRHGMTDEQRQARRKRMLDRFDSNHDGKLDDSERMQLREQMGKMGGDGGGGGGGGGRRHKRGNWGSGAADGITPNGAPGGAPDGAAPGPTPN